MSSPKIAVAILAASIVLSACTQYGEGILFTVEHVVSVSSVDKGLPKSAIVADLKESASMYFARGTSLYVADKPTFSSSSDLGLASKSISAWVKIGAPSVSGSSDTYDADDIAILGNKLLVLWQGNSTANSSLLYWKDLSGKNASSLDAATWNGPIVMPTIANPTNASDVQSYQPDRVFTVGSEVLVSASYVPWDASGNKLSSKAYRLYHFVNATNTVGASISASSDTAEAYWEPYVAADFDATSTRTWLLKPDFAFYANVTPTALGSSSLVDSGMASASALSTLLSGSKSLGIAASCNISGSEYFISDKGFVAKYASGSWTFSSALQTHGTSSAGIRFTSIGNFSLPDKTGGSNYNALLAGSAGLGLFVVDTTALTASQLDATSGNGNYSSTKLYSGTVLGIFHSSSDPLQPIFGFTSLYGMFSGYYDSSTSNASGTGFPGVVWSWE